MRRSFVMKASILPGARPSSQHRARRTRARITAMRKTVQAAPRPRCCSRRCGYAVWRGATSGARSTPACTGSRNRSRTRRNRTPTLRADGTGAIGGRSCGRAAGSSRRRRVSHVAPGEGEADERDLPRARRRATTTRTQPDRCYADAPRPTACAPTALTPRRSRCRSARAACSRARSRLGVERCPACARS